MSAVRVRLSPARELSGYYDSTEFCQFGSSIYDFAFMDVDKILPFSSTLGWHSLNVNGEVQKRKGLRWIPRHPETRQGLDRKVFIKYVEEKNREFNTRQSRCQIWISKDERPDVRVRELTVAALKRRG